MTRTYDLRAAKAEFACYIADQKRYVSITEEQGPLRDGETRILAARRSYIKRKLQWDAELLCWINKDGRPLITKDLIWDTVIAEMRQLDTHGQRLVWTKIKAKFDGILEDDVRAICKVWYKHGLSQLNEIPEVNELPTNNESSETKKLPTNDESSPVNEPSTNDESPETNALPTNDASAEANEPLEDDEPSPVNEPSTNDESPEPNEVPINDASTEVNEPSEDDDSSAVNEAPRNDESSAVKVTPQRQAQSQDDGDHGRQFFKCVLVRQRQPIIANDRPKRRRANSAERLQKYTKILEEKEAKRPSRQAKKDIDGLRGIGAGIYASNAKPFAQEAAERMARTKALAEFVDNASPEASKERLHSQTPSTDADNDNDNDDDDDSDDDSDGDIWQRRLPDPELDAKHMRLARALGHDVEQQVAYGPMYA